jgi:hypothetical protein
VRREVFWGLDCELADLCEQRAAIGMTLQQQRPLNSGAAIGMALQAKRSHQQYAAPAGHLAAQQPCAGLQSLAAGGQLQQAPPVGPHACAQSDLCGLERPFKRQASGGEVGPLGEAAPVWQYVAREEGWAVPAMPKAVATLATAPSLPLLGGPQVQLSRTPSPLLPYQQEPTASPGFATAAGVGASSLPWQAHSSTHHTGQPGGLMRQQQSHQQQQQVFEDSSSPHEQVQLPLQAAAALQLPRSSSAAPWQAAQPTGGASTHHRPFLAVHATPLALSLCVASLQCPRSVPPPS